MVESNREQRGLSRIQVTTNFFRLAKTPINNVSIYSYDFSPEIETDNRSLRTSLLLKQKPGIEALIGLFIRSGNILYSKIKIEVPASFSVLSHDNTEYILTLKWAGFVTGENVDSYRMYANSALKKMLQCLDLKQITKMPKYYDIQQKQRVNQHNLEV